MIRTPFDTLAEYERRSLAHAVAQPAREIAQDQYRGVGYRVGKRRLISNFGEVVEIVPMPPVTPVPGAQPWLLGIGNLRGNLFPVVDLKQFLEGERTVLHEGQRVLVMRQAGGDVQQYFADLKYRDRADFVAPEQERNRDHLRDGFDFTD